MGKRGPRPEPTSLKLLRGVRPSRINHSEPIPWLREVRPPAGLSTPARSIWRDVAPDLVAKRVLTSWERDQFAVYCEAVARHRWACEQLHGNPRKGIPGAELVIQGDRGSVQNPLALVIKAAEATILSFAREFGLTPSSRSSIRTSEPADPADIERLFTPIRHGAPRQLPAPGRERDRKGATGAEGGEP